MTNTHALRPGWTPLTIALMVLGFVVYWPLGLIMIAYIVWGDRLPEFRRNAEGMRDEFHRSFGGCAGRRRHSSRFSESGNQAFDEYRVAELRRLEEERRRLDEERAEFEAFVRNLRRARDQEEFDRFKTDRDRARRDAAARDDGRIVDL